MPKCEIQWIDRNGKPTPDTNEAITTAVSTVSYRDGSVATKRFPCCAHHATQLDDLVRRGPMPYPTDRELTAHYVSQWTRED